MQTKEQRAEPYAFAKLEKVAYCAIDLEKEAMKKIFSIFRIADDKEPTFFQDSTSLDDLYWTFKESYDEAMDDHCHVRLDQGPALIFTMLLWWYWCHFGTEPWIKELFQQLKELVGHVGEEQSTS